MYRLIASAQIGNFFLRGINSFSFMSSYEDLTEQGELIIPRNLKFQGEPVISEGGDSLFKRGDRVVVTAGYFPDEKEIFSGFVSDVKPTTPITFKVENNFWLLKQVTITKTFRTVNLSELLSFMLTELKNSEVYQNANIDISFSATAELTLTNFRINKATIAEVFNKLRDYGVFSFFRGDTLYSGIAVVPALQSNIPISFQRDIVLGSDQLVYNRKDDQKIKLVAVSIDLDNNKTEVTVGDEQGEQRNAYYYNLSEADLKTVAEREIERFKYEGYKGNFTTFGEKIINHGDIIELSDKRYPYRNGDYLVKVNNTSVGFGGYRQIITLDAKVG